ncbi:MAG: PilZ domain-containing protein [Elusimicrobia bacterium]|nr:PilZ domain-containing protein [Elusimicrobiota bacterium]
MGDFSPDPSTHQERRREMRHGRVLPLLLCTQDHASLDVQPTLVDLSAGGFCFNATIPMLPGTRLEFRLLLPGQGSIFGSAKVRWTRPRNAEIGSTSGLEFEPMNPSFKQKLHRYLHPTSSWKTGSGYLDI